MTVEPEQAPVTPRVVSAETGDELLVDESFLSLVDHSRQPIEIVGGPGSGKTTTLKHLAAVLTEDEREGIVLLDGPPIFDVKREGAHRRVVYTAPIPRPGSGAATYHLAAWNDDDLIAYLLACHPAQCRSVMSRLADSPGRDLLGGTPALWRMVLQRMAADPALKDVRDALRTVFREALPSGDLVGKYCVAALVGETATSLQAYRRLKQNVSDEKPLRLLRHPGPKHLLAADRLAALVEAKKRSSDFEGVYPSDVVALVAERLASNARALTFLRRVVGDPRWLLHAFAASVLHATGTDWRPGRSPLPKLGSGEFQGASWSGIDLSELMLDRANFYGANLAEANLDRAFAFAAVFRCADLHDASLRNLSAAHADFAGADLSGAVLHNATLSHADFARAVMHGTDLSHAKLRHADLTDASCCGANLRRCDLRWALLRRTDFRDADLRGASLRYVTVEQPNLAGARLCDAILEGINLEYARLPGVDLQRADLSRALLTGSVMTGADLRHVSLREAALADVKWEGADLRGADFTNAVFQMGSSRSGLVDSFLASEGTRTGFYTDDYQEQHFKSPEEIRKANLCGTDLRGAVVYGADFYLVDLRGAQYTPQQAEHFGRCRAILVDPA